MIDKLTTYSFYIFVFLLPWQTIYILRDTVIAGDRWHYASIGIHLSTLILCSFLSILLVRHGRDTITSLRGASWSVGARMYGLFVVWSAMSIVWAQDALRSLYFVFLLILAGVLFHSAQKGFITVHKVIFVLVLSSIIQATLGIGQFVLQGDFASTLLGTSVHIPWQGGSSVIEGDGQRWLRAYGGMSHPNIFGGFMATMAVLAFAMVVYHARARTMRVFFASGGIIFVAGLMVSFSRSAFIAFVIGMIFLSFVVMWSSREKCQQHIVARYMIIFYVCVIVVFGMAYGDLYRVRGNATERLEQLSHSERLHQVDQARVLIAEHPWRGVGIGNYVTALYARDRIKKDIWLYQPVHNTPLLIVVEVGFIGMGFLALAVISFVHLVWKKWRHGDFLQWGVQASIGTIVITSLFDHWQWDTSFNILLLALFCVLVYSRVRNVSNDI